MRVNRYKGETKNQVMELYEKYIEMHGDAQRMRVGSVLDSDEESPNFGTNWVVHGAKQKEVYGPHRNHYEANRAIFQRGDEQRRFEDLLVMQAKKIDQCRLAVNMTGAALKSKLDLSLRIPFKYFALEDEFDE